MTESKKLCSTKEEWAQFRFGVVGCLLTAPLEKGELRAEIKRLASKVWLHPITAAPVYYGESTIERWYYKAKNNSADRLEALSRKVRSDQGTHPSLSPSVCRVLAELYRDHKSWSYQLHHDNLAALIEEDPSLGRIPSYESVYRYMLAQGMLKQLRRRGRIETEGTKAAEERFENREVRSYEATYVNELWHLDFHAGSLKVLLVDGSWVTPHLLGVLDDCSRLVVHAQWYLHETAENLVHGLCQGFQKRDLCNALMTDNGSAMTAAETTQGLLKVGVVHKTTLAYSPYQNGKQEVFWTQVEGRLLSMLEKVPDLTLSKLNEATLAWVELEYNRKEHSELESETPMQRYLRVLQVGRSCPETQLLGQAFTAKTSRMQRRSDGTITLKGVRFEVNSAYRHLKHIVVRYTSWDLSKIFQVDPQSGAFIAYLYPIDKQLNADGVRRNKAPLATSTPVITCTQQESGHEMAPLLRSLIAEYAATGLPPAYLPKDETSNKKEQ